MMDGEDVYRARLKACLAEADAASLRQVRDKHLTAARSWQALLDAVMERKAGSAALREVASSKAAAQEHSMSDDTFTIPDPVIDALAAGTPAVKAFRQSSGQAQHDVAVSAGMTEERLAKIEQGQAPHGLELAVLSDVLDVPVDLLVDK